MITIVLATEDALSEAVGFKLLASDAQGIEVAGPYRKNGNGYLRSRMDNWREIAKRQGVLVLTDLDRALCPPSLIDAWSGAGPLPPNLLLRIAVREVESWLLADHEAMRSLIGVRGTLPEDPDQLPDPKQYLIGLARRAPRDVRLDIVPEPGTHARQGLGYNNRLVGFVRDQWNPDRAEMRSRSLLKTRDRLQALGRRLKEKATLLIAASLLCLAQPAQAGFVDGQALLEYCKDPMSNLCGGYIAALVDYQDALQTTDTPAITFCLPERSNLGALRDMVIGVLERQTPRELQKNAASLVVPAFAKAFRCP
jgi:hypothetical protein